ncbi:hypothetical protein [Maridesulfovibrio sp.]|uniref:hypothetical protein n=1 Tax=Maridesulfovibrio sp. TaxID=2795000 RepID=UPI003AFF83E1
MDQVTEKDSTLKRLKNAYLAMPVSSLEIEKANVFGPLFKDSTVTVSDIDTQHLAIKLIDFLAELLAVGRGASKDEIVEHISDCVKQMCPQAENGLCEKIASRVLDRLANGQDGYKAFSYSFYDQHAGEVRVFSFRLIEYWQPSLGEPHVFRATPEAVTLFLSMFTIDPILEHAAQNFLIRHLLESNHFKGAIEVARKASGISIATQAELHSRMLDLKRNPRKRGWVDDIINRLKAAQKHITERNKEERGLLNKIRDMLESEDQTAEQLDDLIRLKGIIEKCNVDHLNLGASIGSAVSDFDKYHIHAFVTPSISVRISPEEQVIPCVMDMPFGDAFSMADSIGCFFLGPREPKVLDFFELFSMFEEARSRELMDSVKEEPDVVDVDECSLNSFDEEREGRIRAFIDSYIHKEKSSSALDILNQMDRASCDYEREDYAAAVHILRSIFRRESELDMKASTDGVLKHRFAAGMNLLVDLGKEEIL